MTGYLVSTSPQSPTVTVPPGATSAVLTGLRPGIAYTVQVAAQTSAGTGDQVAAPGTVKTAAPGGSFVGLKPARVLDTRSGLGAPKGPTTQVALTVDGHGGVPASGVAAVAMNVTVTQASANGVITAYPAGQALPVASNLNYSTGQNVANFVVVPVGTGGVVDLHATASTQLIADVSGYYTTAANASPTSGLYHPISPTRVLDTRTDTGGSEPGPGQVVDLQVIGQGPVPESGVASVVLNVTVTQPTANGLVTAYPGGAARPNTSSINFRAGQTLANRVIVPVGRNGDVQLYNGVGKTQIVADVTGWYTDGTDASAGGSYYVAVTPHRLVDTRKGVGSSEAQVGPGGILIAQVSGVDGLPAATAQTPPTAAVLTVTLVDETSSTFVSVYPSLAQRPSTSDVNALAHQTVPNLALPGLGVDGAVDLFNSAGSTDLVVDLSGYFIGDVHPPASTYTAPAGAVTTVTSDASGPSSVVLAAGTPVPQIGQVIASPVTASAPSGLLAEVTSVGTDSAGDTVANVQPATLQQALGDSDIAISAPLDATELVSTQAEPGVRTSGASATATRRGQVIDVAQLRARSIRPASSNPVNAKDTQACTADNTSSVTVSDSFNPTLVFNASIGHSGLLPKVTARAGIDMTETAGISVAFGGTVSCQWSARLATYTFEPVEFEVAGVPVVIVPVFTLTMNGSAHGDAQVSASMSQNFHAQAGIDFDNGSVNPYESVGNSFTHTGPTLTSANATASVALTGDLEGKFYDLAGPEVSLTGTLTANVDPTQTPWWTLGFDLTADAALHIKVLFAAIDMSDSFDVYRATIAQAGSSPGSSPPVIITTALPNATTGTHYSTELTTADHRTGSWSIAGGSLPPGLTLSGYTVSGTPTTAGTATFTLKFTDTTGHTVQAQAKLIVYQGATGPTTGTITGRVTDNQGGRLADVDVTLYLCNPFCAADPMAGTLTAADGTYSFADVAPGQDYVVCFDGSQATGGDSDATGYVFTCYGYTDSVPWATDVTVTAGRTTSGIGVAVVPGGAVTGRITDTSGNPLADNAFAAALTDYFGGLEQDPVRVPEVYTGGNGVYLLKGIAQGPDALCFAGAVYPVSPTSTGYASDCYGDLPISASLQNTIQITAGETVTGISGQIGMGAALSGTVTDTKGNPLGNVYVTVTGVSGTDPAGYSTEYFYLYTDSSGDYTVGNLTPGTNYAICFDGTGATGAAAAPYGYSEQCYNGVAINSENPTLVNETAGQFVTGINGRLTANTAAVGSVSRPLTSGPGAKSGRSLPIRAGEDGVTG